MSIITPAPPAPDRTDPATFADRADNFVAWMGTLAAEINGGALGATFVNGTVGEPSVRGNTDTNTGLNFLGSDQLQLVTNGVQRVRVSNGETLVDQSLRVAGIVQVTASNALDSLGDGQQIVGVNAADVATVNGPSGASRGVVHQQWLNASYIVQTYSETNGTTSRQWVRFRDNGTWRAWRLVHNNATMVGTVSQASSIPAGAIFEEGNNANGHYIRWASGMQLCAAALTIVSGGTISWTYPAAFSGTSAIFYQGTAQTTDDRTVTGSNATTTSMDWYGYTTVGAAWNGPIRVLAFGRWF